ncbi:MAG: energy-coupling factor transporter ATPase [Ruminococcaceae bacterium]|nr:energy-coupling factor transporter ATPase [Oscillospiraceae bacterium]
MSKITLENISYVYSPGTPFEMHALTDINLNIRENAITGLIGHTGSGKSTLVQLLNGLTRPTSGRVLLDGKDIWQEPKKIKLVRFRVGLVMQYPEYQLFEETVRADIAFGPKNMGLSAEEIAERVSEAAALTGLDASLLDHSPFDLSGGQKRRVAIAGVIAMRPEVLVLDEPAAGLDPRGRDTILNMLRDYQQKTGATVIIVSHSMEDMARFCDDIIVLAHGKLVMQGRGHEVFARSQELSDVGLNIPEISRLCLSLRERGIPVDDGIFTVEQAEQCLLRLLASRKQGTEGRA